MAEPQPGAPPDVEITDEPEEPGPVPPVGMPYTVFFPVDGTLRPADLEHAAPLPRVGDAVEYIDERGACRRYVVTEVIHTLQMSAAARPAVGEDPYPNAFARHEDEEAETPGDGGSLRAGLPKVILREAGRGGATKETSGFRVRRSRRAATRPDEQEQDDG